MSYKDVLAVVVPPHGENAIAAAQAVARKQGGKVSALFVELELEPLYTIEATTGYVDAELWLSVRDKVHEEFVENRTAVEQAVARSDAPISSRTVSVPLSLLKETVALESRYADLTVVTQPPYRANGAENVILEAALFGSGRSVLVAPRKWRAGDDFGRNIVVGWNGKREAARALSAAAPFIDQADKVEIVTIGWDHHGATDSSAASAHMARRGVKAHTGTVDPRGRTEAAALLDACHEFKADMLVLGGYGHSRLQEFVLGGVTRDLIENTDVPLFMAH